MFPFPVRTLHTYLTRQILGSLVLTVAVFTFVLLLGSAISLWVVAILPGVA